MDSRLDYLIECLDFHLRRGLDPDAAWSAALDDYFHVHHVDDGRSEIARSAERVLLHFDMDEQYDKEE